MKDGSQKGGELQYLGNLTLTALLAGEFEIGVGNYSVFLLCVELFPAKGLILTCTSILSLNAHRDDVNTDIGCRNFNTEIPSKILQF